MTRSGTDARGHAETPHRGGLLTVGHGTLDRPGLTTLFDTAGIELLVDVRRFPASRRHPHVNRGALEAWLPEQGIEYRWEERLGGRRTPRPDSPHTAVRNAQFRAYADHMASDDWRAALRDLLTHAGQRTVAVMCAESVWWRCHRRFIADAALALHHVPVRHLMHHGREQPHRMTDGARVVGDRLLYDAGASDHPTLFDR